MKYHNGEWNYDDYTPEWVKPRIQKRNGLEVVTLDQANHPLNKKKRMYNLNTTVQYFRHPNYPFWVSGHDIDKGILSCFAENEEVSHNDFMRMVIRERAQPVYEYFCGCWYDTTIAEMYNEKRSALILISKGM